MNYTGHPNESMIKCAGVSEIRYQDRLKQARAITGIKVLVQPRSGRADGATNAVSKAQEDVDNVRSNVCVGPSDQDCRPRGKRVLVLGHVDSTLPTDD